MDTQGILIKFTVSGVRGFSVEDKTQVKKFLADLDAKLKEVYPQTLGYNEIYQNTYIDREQERDMYAQISLPLINKVKYKDLKQLLVDFYEKSEIKNNKNLKVIFHCIEQIFL